MSPSVASSPTESPGRPSIIVVTGGVGGCGATSIALHLARERAARERVCFVEAAACAGAAERLMLDRTTAKTWPTGDRSPDAFELAALPVEPGFRALLAPPGQTLDCDVAEIFSGLFDAIVVDAPRGLATVAGVRVAVLTPSEPAARRTRGLLGDTTCAVVVNRTGPGGEATRARIESLLGTTVAVELPVCRALRDAEDGGWLVRRPSRWLARLERLSRAIAVAQANDA